jgi:hypothetical protein
MSKRKTGVLDLTGKFTKDMLARLAEAEAQRDKLLDLLRRVAGHAKLGAALPVLLLQDIDAVLARAKRAP